MFLLFSFNDTYFLKCWNNLKFTEKLQVHTKGFSPSHLSLSYWHDAPSHLNTCVYSQQTQITYYKPQYSHHPWEINMSTFRLQNPQTLPNILHRLRITCLLCLVAASVWYPSVWNNSSFFLWLSKTWQFWKITGQLFCRMSLD